jgi:hypothetical protein
LKSGIRAVTAALAIVATVVAEEHSTNCTFQVEPDRFTAGEARARRQLAERLRRFEQGRQTPVRAQNATVDLASLPRRSYIDNYIFDKIQAAGVRPAALSDDYEFCRRVYLDLTGRIPTPSQIRDFVADASPSKREQLIDRLLYSQEFVDKWMLWLGDLMQNASINSLQPIQIQGRNAYHGWLRRQLDYQVSLRTVVFEALTKTGINYDVENGAANWTVRSRTPGGPIQDTYDNSFSRAASQFLGMSHYDCVLCHNGRGHLDLISLWGRSATRTEAQRMAAFFSRTRWRSVSNDRTDPNYLAYEITDAATGTYDLNTGFGNRPERSAIGATRNLTPIYRNGVVPTTGAWRREFATQLTQDRMFARNMANRIWKQVFNLALVEPVDQLDPARLDPKNPPRSDWTLQASHPALLEDLAAHIEAVNFDLRDFLKILMNTSAYQLSSRYDGEWNITHTALFARHYPRRLEGEEVHDAIQMATGVLGSYAVAGWEEPVRWATQLPEPVEPRSNGAAANFMNTFFRGNRDTQERQQQGSILQQLALMNDNGVLSRIRNGVSPAVRKLATATDLPSAVDEIYLTFLSRLPSVGEKAKTLSYLQQRGPANRNSAAEDIAWSLINRTEFIFSY